MIVTVTQDHIDKGVRNDCTECALALALRPHFSFTIPGVFDSCVVVLSGGQLKYSDLPENAEIWLRKFDLGQEVEPFEFELDI